MKLVILHRTKLVHKFENDLHQSLSDNEICNDFYCRYFGIVNRDIQFVEDINIQKAGIDKILILPSTKITIEEKIRYEDFPDILLELYSVVEKEKQGWLFTSISTYIAYASIPANKICLLPTKLLRQAWFSNKDLWLSKYMPFINSLNKGYTTRNIAIPQRVLFDAIKEQGGIPVCSPLRLKV